MIHGVGLSDLGNISGIDPHHPLTDFPHTEPHTVVQTHLGRQGEQGVGLSAASSVDLSRSTLSFKVMLPAWWREDTGTPGIYLFFFSGGCFCLCLKEGRA